MSVDRKPACVAVVGDRHSTKAASGRAVGCAARGDRCDATLNRQEICIAATIQGQTGRLLLPITWPSLVSDLST
jgi:hypothetical protein